MEYIIKKSTRKYKKYVAVFSDRSVNFGDNRYGQFKDQTKLKLYSHLDNKDPKRKKLYYIRHGVEASKYSPKWFSHKYLW